MQALRHGRHRPDRPARSRHGAIVSRGGRPDTADKSLRAVRAPNLLIVGGDDLTVIDLNRQAYAQLQRTKELKIVPGATHLFEEPGTLEEGGTAGP